MARVLSERGASIAVANQIRSTWSMARKVKESLSAYSPIPDEIKLVQGFLANEISPEFELIKMLEHGVTTFKSGCSVPKKWVNIASDFLKYFFIFPFFRLKNTGKSANINNGEKMDISVEKLWLIEHLLKIQDEVLLHRIKAFIENLLGKKPAVDLEPMSLETFYNRIEDSEAALERGDIITQNELREEIKTWKKT